MRIRLLQFLVAVFLVSPVFGEETKAPSKPEPGTSVEMPFLIAPMSKDGKLLGYAYISSKLICTSGPATVAVREKLAFIQDANVRDVNAHPVARAEDPMKVDDEALSLRLVEIARRIVGASKVVRMEFTQIQFAPLHPSDSTLGMVSSQEKAAALAQTAITRENAASTAPATTAAASPAATPKPPAGQSH